MLDPVDYVPISSGVHPMLCLLYLRYCKYFVSSRIFAWFDTPYLSQLPIDRQATLCSVVLVLIHFALAGKGLFATKSLDPGKFLLEYKGDLLTSEEASMRQKMYIGDKHHFMYDFSHMGEILR